MNDIEKGISDLCNTVAKLRDELAEARAQITAKDKAILDLFDQLSKAVAQIAAKDAALTAGLSACDQFDAPPSKSAFVNGQSTAAQQIRAALAKPDAQETK